MPDLARVKTRNEDALMNKYFTNVVLKTVVRNYKCSILTLKGTFVLI
jgi:hypothetical protein